MRLPDFLVIGAMKAGSTTLYHDLVSQPGVFLPEKEQNFFCNDCLDQPAAVEKYGSGYMRAKRHQVCGDVSTTYSMLPDITGVPARVLRLLSRDVKIVYLVREPVSRLISHHRHMSCWHGAEKMQGSVDECVQTCPSLIHYSCYAMQLRPWLETFGRDAVRVLRFEDYVSQRAGTINDLCRFLGVACRTEQIETETIFNRSKGKPVFTDLWATIAELGAYRKVLRPLLPAPLRRVLYTRLLPAAPPAPSPPSADTIEQLLDVFQDDVELLRQLTGAAAPLWDLAAVRRTYTPIRAVA